MSKAMKVGPFAEPAEQSSSDEQCDHDHIYPRDNRDPTYWHCRDCDAEGWDEDQT